MEATISGSKVYGGMVDSPPRMVELDGSNPSAPILKAGTAIDKWLKFDSGKIK